MSPAKKAAKPAKPSKAVKLPQEKPKDEDVLGAIGKEISKVSEIKPVDKPSAPPKKEEILEEVTDADLDFSFVTEAVKKEDAAATQKAVPAPAAAPKAVPAPATAPKAVPAPAAAPKAVPAPAAAPKAVPAPAAAPKAVPAPAAAPKAVPAPAGAPKAIPPAVGSERPAINLPPGGPGGVLPKNEVPPKPPEDLGLDEAELADMQAAISENIQKAETSGDVAPGAPPATGVVPPEQPTEGGLAPTAEGTVAPSTEAAQATPVPLEPLTPEMLQPATEQILDMHRHMRELVRELNNNLNMINSDRLKDALQKLTIDIQAEEETLKDYNQQTAAFLSAIVANTFPGDERTFKEREIRKIIANAYEEHRECTDHAKQLTDLLQVLAEDQALPADQKGLLTALDTTFIVELADKQRETFQGILDSLQINLEELLKQKTEAAQSANTISNELQQKIEDELRQKSEAASLPPVSREEFIQFVSTKRDKIWYHAIWYLVFSVDDHVATKKALFDALNEVTSKSAIDNVKENVFYFGLGPLLKLRLEEGNVVRYRDQTFKLNTKIDKISEVLQACGEPISPRPQISAEKQKDMIDSFLKDDFLDI